MNEWIEKGWNTEDEEGKEKKKCKNFAEGETTVE